MVEESQQELKTQQTELQNINAELETQIQRVNDSEVELKAQQVELEVSNVELQNKNTLLEQQKEVNEQARRNLTVQTEELALASKYKSEFLANMSHELRTPLNSLLLLARSLRENKVGNLSEDQVETAGVIYDSGSDLLNLINEILDLSKIESGKMELRIEPVDITELMRIINVQFAPMAKNQGVELSEYPHVEAWFNAIDQRPAVKRGVEVLTALRQPFHDDKAKEVLFGIKADKQN